MLVKKFMPTELVDSHVTTRFDGAADFFKFNISYWEELFKSVDHPLICIAPNLDEATTDMLKEKDIIIVVDTDKDTVSNTMKKVRDNDDSGMTVMDQLSKLGLLLELTQK